MTSSAWDDDNCRHGMNPDWCGECKPPKAPEPTEAIHPDAIKARYRGKCSECRDPIDEDDWIVPNGQGGWIHDECGA